MCFLLLWRKPKESDGKIRHGVGIMHIAVNKENQALKICLHEFVKSTSVTVKETALATGAVIHVFPPNFGNMSVPFTYYTAKDVKFLMRILLFY